jgi:tRNA-dihydrouridine synthase A
MMDWTDRHCRYFHRLLAPDARLYTEMVHATAILRGDRERLLGFDPAEQPVALQLGGSEPEELAAAAAIGEAFGYAEINLNCGCPSERVQRGRFGACLMQEPERVADCVATMRSRVRVPVTIKCRIGIDDSEETSFLDRFIDETAAAGCRTFIIHARKAWLKGLSPKENRELPPLRYEVVARLKAQRPDVVIVLNGGLRDPLTLPSHLEIFEGVMLGRLAYQEPWQLAHVQARLFGTLLPDRSMVLARMADYAAAQAEAGVPLRAIARHMLGLFNGEPGARRFRRSLSEVAGDEAPDRLLAAANAFSIRAA